MTAIAPMPARLLPLLVLLAQLRLWLPAPAPLSIARPAAPACARRVAVLGQDMSAGGRFEVQRALAVGPHTVQVDQGIEQERRMAGGLIPLALLSNVAVSSALLRPLPAGAGLTITLNRAITLDTAQSYANALLTAGITDAEVGVAAPTSQPALGTAAMLGLLRAARITCHTVDAARERLAIREVVLTSELAQSAGRLVAPRLLFAVKAAAVARGLADPAALSRLVTRDAGALHMGLSIADHARLVAFLHDLVASGTFAAIASAHPSMVGVTARRAVARLAPLTGGAKPQAEMMPVSHAPTSGANTALMLLALLALLCIVVAPPAVAAYRLGVVPGRAPTLLSRASLPSGVTPRALVTAVMERGAVAIDKGRAALRRGQRTP